MTIITDAELAAMRSHADDTLTDTCTIQRATRTADGQGGWTESWSNTYSNVACRLDVRQGALGITGDIKQRRQQITSHIEYVLRVKWNQDIEPGDRVVVSGDTFEVETVSDAHTWLTLKRAKLTRLD